jgi:hypothetical protein
MYQRRATPAGLAAAVAIGITLAAAYGGVLWADHSWGDYHWARTTASFDLTVVNSTTADWDPFVAAALADWSDSDALNMVEDATGSTSTRDRRQCKAPTGKVRICNLAYGNNGWLGVAGISIDAEGHIFTGYTKLNDTYFSWDPYNTDLWKQSVTCQELGHNVGLDHQDENFGNDSLLSCMDYQDPPFAFANAHDFNQLETIYAHLDSYDSYAGAGAGGGGGGDGCNAPPGKGCNRPQVVQSDGWGISLGRRGTSEQFIRIDPAGIRHITFVRWISER